MRFTNSFFPSAKKYVPYGVCHAMHTYPAGTRAASSFYFQDDKQCIYSTGRRLHISMLRTSADAGHAKV